MARTELTKTDAPGGYAHTGQKLTFEAADTSNLNEFKASGKDLLVARNDDTSAHNVTVTSKADPYNRTQNIDTYSVPSGETHIFGPFPRIGWEQSGVIQCEADNSSVYFAVINL
jgi:hypothetical protein